jgi:transcriptional regulator GlxA family with amidase domain
MNHISSPTQLDSAKPLKVTIPVLAECRTAIVIKLIEADPARELTLEQLAQQVGISLPQLRSDFKKYRGVTLAHYRKQQSLALAHHLISVELLTVADAMERTGFHNIARFDEVFKKAYGMNPGECRRQSTLRKRNYSRGFQKV